MTETEAAVLAVLAVLAEREACAADCEVLAEGCYGVASNMIARGPAFSWAAREFRARARGLKVAAACIRARGSSPVEGEELNHPPGNPDGV